MSEQQPVYRNRQTVLGLVVRPRQQMRLAMFFIAATWAAHACLMIVFDDFDAGVYLAVSAFSLSVFALVSGVVLSHRLFGPLISIKRHIASLREGQYSARLQLRENDDLAEIKDSLNDLAAALEQRHGPGTKSPS